MGLMAREGLYITRLPQYNSDTITHSSKNINSLTHKCKHNTHLRSSIARLRLQHIVTFCLIAPATSTLTYLLYLHTWFPKKYPHLFHKCNSTSGYSTHLIPSAHISLTVIKHSNDCTWIGIIPGITGHVMPIARQS